MNVKITKPWDKFKDCDVTPEEVFNNRRNILKQMGFIGAGALLSSSAKAGIFDLFGDKKQTETFVRRELPHVKNSLYAPALHGMPTPESKVISHNNFYEFGTAKTDPIDNAQAFKVDPWTLTIDGLVDKPLTLSYDELFKTIGLEERIYKLRCVEAWSMVIPWVGFSLGKLLDKAGIRASAKYVAFQTLFDSAQMPGQASLSLGGGIDYPYVEGLTIAEALNELTLLSVGLYGKTLPPQNGAPIRLVVPWKYGFKSIKSIVKITLTDKQPKTSWNQLAPHEYGFYANVNPNVDHPRWSQATERRIGEGGLFSAKRIETSLFNGYQQQVSQLYKNLDLNRFY